MVVTCVAVTDGAMTTCHMGSSTLHLSLVVQGVVVVVVIIIIKHYFGTLTCFRGSKETLNHLINCLLRNFGVFCNILNTQLHALLTSVLAKHYNLQYYCAIFMFYSFGFMNLEKKKWLLYSTGQNFVFLFLMINQFPFT